MRQRDEYYMDPRVAERYDAETGDDFQGDRAFYLGLAEEATARGQAVLELAVGTGRLAIPMARAGAKVVGLDRSRAMLEVARRKADGLDRLSLIEGDMADFHLDQRFGLVMIPFRSFLHLMTIEDQRACLSCVYEHLEAGGRLALNFFNPDIVMIGNWLGPKRESAQRIRDVQLPNGRKLEWSTRRYQTSEQRLDEDRIEERLDAGGVVISRVYRKMSLRYVFRYEMQHLLELSGFEVEALYGGFHGEPFSDSSPEMVWVARRPPPESGGASVGR